MIPWEIWIDTGGTFTDSISIDPDGKCNRLKILSNGSLRGKISEVRADGSIVVSMRWNVNRDIFRGYKIRILDSSISGIISEVNIEQNSIGLEHPFDNSVSGMTFEITADEEVPILAARMHTETPLDSDFPAMEMRLGTTKGTNTLLERNGAPTALITNHGYKDLVLIGNQQRPNLFELNVNKPEPLHSIVFEVPGRLDYNGKILEKSDVNTEISLGSDIRSVAVSMVNSYRNGCHEGDYKQVLRAMGIKYITCASEISNEIKMVDRTSTAIVNAYLDPIMSDFVSSIQKVVPGSLQIMSSAGGLMEAAEFLPKDSLLSGPAGGVVGASYMARLAGIDKIISFDMGGTSTDVALYEQHFDYRYSSQVGSVSIQSPSLAIESIASGGGSVCKNDGQRFTVGPDSMGASPGPACYGEGGMLTITDVNLLLGRLVPQSFSIPVDKEKSVVALDKFFARFYERNTSRDDVLESILQIANEKMADAIRKISVKKGIDPADYSLLAFGGAGGQHACSVASLLNISTILIPYDAGLLSARGIGMAEVEVILTNQILKPLLEIPLGKMVDKLIKKSFAKLKSENAYVKQQLGYFRFSGQEDVIEVDLKKSNSFAQFKSKYKKIYGHWLENLTIEVESIKVISAIPRDVPNSNNNSIAYYQPLPVTTQRCYSTEWMEVPVFHWEQLHPGARVLGPAIVVSNNSTLFCDRGWEAILDTNNTFKLISIGAENKTDQAIAAASIELFTNRFFGVAEEMGALLQRTSFSVNIRERLDFSCGLLDAEGELIVNAPHIPVHLGSLGLCARMVADELMLSDGDIVITNHPYYGGSHLPDISLIAPVFVKGVLIGYVANRAHHAEIGGMTPGSMPTNATLLEQEGVIIKPLFLFKNGKPQWELIREVFQTAKYPTRAVEENIADLEGAVASILRGKEKLLELCRKFGAQNIVYQMRSIKDSAASLIGERIRELNFSVLKAQEYLDDGSQLAVAVRRDNDRIIFDFEDTSEQHKGNLNATPAIVRSVLLYVLRVLLDKDFPLNEGLLRDIDIYLPHCLLNPEFNKGNDPAVVGGNTEVSQRLTDTLLKAFGVVACSQGTMNNLLFGNSEFAYYETICGGVGAGQGFSGASAVHQHMTNTRITDPEILELKYPARLVKFEIRANSGGRGKFRGGNGVIREIEFTDKVTFTLLSQHRNEAPFGLKGGEPGLVGKQRLLKGSKAIILDGISSGDLEKGDRLVIETPGGGGFGRAN